MITLLFCLIAYAAPASSDRVQIKEVFGAREVKVLLNNKEKTLFVGDELFLGNTVETKAKQIVVLEGFDRSQWKVAPETTLKLEKRLSEKKTISYWVFNLVKGNLFGQVTPQPDKDGFRQKVITKNAALGIRGTKYLLSSDQNSELDVLEGSVWWGTSPEFEANSYVEVKAGEHSEVQNKEVKKPVPSSLNGDDLLNKYHFVLSQADIEETAKANVKSPNDCRVHAQGWKSKDGTNRGECFRASPKDLED